MLRFTSESAVSFAEEMTGHLRVPRVYSRVPTVMEKHGKAWKKYLVMKSHGKWAEKIKSWKLKNILKKSWNFFTADHELRTRSSDNSISTGLLQ